MSDLRTPVATDTTATASRSDRLASYRAVARFIDVVLDLAAAGGAVLVLGLLQYGGRLFGLDWLENFARDARWPVALITLVVFHLYNSVYRTSAGGRSLGKGQLGLTISGSGESVSLAGALTREALTIVPIGPVTALFDPERRGLNDRLAATRVHSTDASPAPGIHRDVRVFRAVGQIVAVVAVLGLIRWLVGNLLDNLDEQNIGTDFGFLDTPTQFTPSEDRGFDPRSPVRQMVWVGIKNTFLSAFAGILLASILGLIIGVARLSKNWLAAKLASLYVETFRNIPPLVIIIFFGFAIFTFGPFPILREATELKFWGTDTNYLILSNTNWGIPSLAERSNVGLFWILVLVALAAAIAVGVWRTRLNERIGTPHHRVLFGLATFIGLVVIIFVALGGPYDWSWPALSENRRRIEGGFATSAGYLALTVALGMYTASHIAEIIRGSILAVPKGQTEASNALALSGFQRLRYVVLPQALRIAIPPTINQYLNLVKNTSLGIAVAYAEITLLTKSSIGNGRPAPQSILVLMTVYLSFSILISIVLNRVNRRFQLAGR